MAGDNSFPSLSRHSKRGISPTYGASIDQSTSDIAPSMSIGAVDELSFLDGPSSSPPVIPFSTNADNFQKKNPYPVNRKNPDQSKSSVSVDDEEILPRSYVEKEEVKSPFPPNLKNRSSDDFLDLSSSQTAKRDIHAVKVVTKLVQGISFSPGSNASGQIKSSALRDQLVQVNRIARDITRVISVKDQNTGWLIAQCAEVVSDLVAKRSERIGLSELENSTSSQSDSQPLRTDPPVSIEAQVEAISDIFLKIDSDDDLSLSIDAMSGNFYLEASNSDIMKDRLSVSIAAATWDIHDRVVESGFLFGMKAIEVVGLLTTGLVKAASETSIQILSPDMKTAHLQGSIRRLAGLIGAEYTVRARRHGLWVKEGGESGDTTREAASTQKFKNMMLAEIVLSARKNFYSIEKIAPKLMDEIFKEKVQNTESHRPS